MEDMGAMFYLTRKDSSEGEWSKRDDKRIEMMV